MNKINRMKEGSFIIKTNTKLVQTEWKKAFITFGFILRLFSCLHISEKVRTLWTIVNRNGLPSRWSEKGGEKKQKYSLYFDWLTEWMKKTYIDCYIFILSIEHSFVYISFFFFHRKWIECKLKQNKKNRRKMFRKVLNVRLMKSVVCRCVHCTVYRFRKQVKYDSNKKQPFQKLKSRKWIESEVDI